MSSGTCWAPTPRGTGQPCSLTWSLLSRKCADVTDLALWIMPLHTVNADDMHSHGNGAILCGQKLESERFKFRNRQVLAELKL